MRSTHVNPLAVPGTLALLLLPLFAAVSNAQTAANWSLKSPQTNPPPRLAHAMAYDSAHDQVVLFGGTTGATNFNDTWVWDGSNWTRKSPQNSPPARFSHAMAYDSAHGKVVLFGGTTGATVSTFLTDTWVWDGSNWTQKTPQTSPPVREDYAMAYDSAHGQVVLFGGDAPGVFFNDTWVWDGSNWTQKSPQTSPPQRYGHAMAYDSAHGQVVLFGGIVPFLFSNDTWTWDGSNWSQKSPQTFPLARSWHAMAYDYAHGQVVLNGGVSSAGNFGDTWVWDGSNWTQKSPQTSPPGRGNHAMAYDSGLGQVVLFGGGSIGSPLGDTWVWSGGSGGTPAINSVVTASGFGGFSSVAPGSWVEIYGSNLAASSRTWGGADFSGDNAPTSLDGVQVTIGGQHAYIDYISAGQINAQLPSGIGTGPQQVIVTSGSASSAPVNITVNNTQPGLLAPPTFKIGANQYVVALLPDGVTYILPSGSIAGVSSRPAKPGETIVLYGVGFGAVTPSIAAGQIVTQSNQLASPLQIMFGQTPAQLSYYGLSPGFVGLYQFNVVVPAVANGDLVPVTFNLGGVAGSQTLYTAVRQ